MNYKAYLYVITVLLSAYALSGILVIITSLIMGYLLTNFITDFFNVSSLIK